MSDYVPICAECGCASHYCDCYGTSSADEQNALSEPSDSDRSPKGIALIWSTRRLWLWEEKLK